jgi:branched-chain amino acid transport system substrate-binding protein
MTAKRLAPLLTAALMLASPAARADITIAFAGPITGGAASFGDQMRFGAELAVKALNDNGGVLGQPVKLVLGDDACDPKQGVTAARDLVAKNVAFVAGHFCSAASIAAAPVYAEAGVVMISPASTQPSLTEQGLTNVFRVCGRDDQQGTVAASYILKNFPGKKIALIHDKRSYARGLVDAVAKGLKQAGVQPAMLDSINQGEKDYAALVSKLANSGIDVVYLPVYQTEAALIVRQADEHGYHPVFMGGDALLAEEFPAIAGKSADGVLMTFTPDPTRLPAAAPLVEEYRKAGRNPEGWALYTYAAIQAWAQAAKAAGTSAGPKVEAALHQGKFDTVVGAVEFDSHGDVKTPQYVVYRWQGGRYAPVD